jgi:peptidoglycan hydrolase CwlO-like protein
MIKLSKINTIHGKKMSEPIFDILKVDTMTDINGIEVQIPRVVETTTATEIQSKIDSLNAQIAELQSQLDASKEIEIPIKEEVKPVKEVEEEVI